MKKLRAVVSQPMSARSNIALTAAMMELHRAGRIPDTVRLYSYPKSVLLGRNQQFSQEVNERECVKKGIEVARRITGGGAIYMDRGVAAWDLIADARQFGGEPAKAKRQIAEAVSAAMSRLGLPAVLRGHTEIEVIGRKVCGMSGTFDGPTLVCQGSVLVNADIRQMWLALKLSHPASFLEFSGRVANLSEFFGRKTEVSEVHRAIVVSLATKLNYTVERDGLLPVEQETTEQLFKEELGEDGFVHDPDSGISGATTTPGSVRAGSAV